MMIEAQLFQLQKKCLKIFDIIDKICRDHQIHYSLCGGSVVGAHLYKGFLPWDDDIDLMMTRDNYNKFLSLAETHLPEGYSILNYLKEDNHSIIKENFCKIIDDNTTIVQQNGYILGIFVDITVYDRVPESPLKQIDLFLYKRAMTIKRGKMPGNSIKNIIRNILLDTIFFNRRKYMIFFQGAVEFLGKTCKQYTYRELFGAYYFVNMIPFEPSIFENYSEIEFEGRSAMVVRDYIDYLHTRYNRTDFKEPKEKQVPSHYSYIDLNTPYREYIKRKNIPNNNTSTQQCK